MILLIASMTFLLAGLAFGQTAPVSLEGFSTIFYNITVGIGTVVLAFAAYKAGKTWIPQRAFEQKRQFIDDAVEAYNQYFDSEIICIEAKKKQSYEMYHNFDSPSRIPEYFQRYGLRKYQHLMTDYEKKEILDLAYEKMKKSELDASMLILKTEIHKARLESTFRKIDLSGLCIDRDMAPLKEEHIIETRKRVDQVFINLYKHLANIKE